MLTRVLKSLRSWDLLFVAAVVIALGFLAWWPFDVVRVTTKGIKWTDLVVAFGIPVTIGITAVFALHQLREAEKSRYAALAADLTRRWDEDSLIESRRALIMHNHDEIRDIIAATFKDGITDEEADAFFVLQKLPNFIETLAAIESEFGLEREFVNRLWGSVIVSSWDRWSAAVEFVRDQPGGENAFKNFQRLVDDLRELRAKAGA